MAKGQFQLALLMLKHMKGSMPAQQVKLAVNPEIRRVKSNGVEEVTKSLMTLCQINQYIPGMLFLAEECEVDLPTEYLMKPEESIVHNQDDTIDYYGAIEHIDSILVNR